MYCIMRSEECGVLHEGFTVKKLYYTCNYNNQFVTYANPSC